jgi:hypothetical protein
MRRRTHSFAELSLSVREVFMCDTSSEEEAEEQQQNDKEEEEKEKEEEKVPIEKEYPSPVREKWAEPFRDAFEKRRAEERQEQEAKTAKVKAKVQNF